MRVTPKQYALALYESVNEKSAGQVKVVLKKFVELLAGKNQLGLAEKIIKEFSKLWNAERGLVEAEVASASELGRETVKLLKGYIAKLSGAEEVKVEEKVDQTILGGVVIRYGDKILDGSLKTALADLKDKLIK